MAHFSIMSQGNPNIAHSSSKWLKTTTIKQSLILCLVYKCLCLLLNSNSHCFINVKFSFCFSAFVKNRSMKGDIWKCRNYNGHSSISFPDSISKTYDVISVDAPTTSRPELGASQAPSKRCLAKGMCYVLLVK